MERAWRRVRSNRGAPGADGVSVRDFPALARTTGPKMKAVLISGHYTPNPIRQVAIPKPSDGERVLGIPTVLGRLIQQSILHILARCFRTRASVFAQVDRAVKQVKTFVQAGHEMAVDVDLEKFNVRVQHDLLMRW